MGSTFTGKKLLLFIPFVMVVFFGFNRLHTAQAVNPGLSPTQMGPGAADIATTPDDTEKVVVTIYPTAVATESIQDTPTSIVPDPSFPSLDEFISQVVKGRTCDVCGLYIQGITALKIVQQPLGNLGYIDQNLDTATQFQSASLFGVVGLLAHNFLAGGDFFKIKTGQDMILVYGDGSVHHYQAANIVDYQRLTPTDMKSDFRELASGQQLTADQLFNLYYHKAHHLILQTCILNDGDPNWGVRFIDGDPVQ